MLLISSVNCLNLRTSLLQLLTDLSDVFPAGLLTPWKRNHSSVLGNVKSKKPTKQKTRTRNKFPDLFFYTLRLKEKLLTFPVASNSADLKLAPNRTQLRAIYLYLHFHFTDIGGICVADGNWPVLESYTHVSALWCVLVLIQPCHVSCIQRFFLIELLLVVLISHFTHGCWKWTPFIKIYPMKSFSFLFEAFTSGSFISLY